MSIALSIRLPEPLETAIERLARTLDRPKTYVVRKALEAYVAEYADYQIALGRLRDKDDAILLGVEFRKRLGL